MTIAIHISTRNEDISENINYRIFTRLALQKTEHHFIFITHRKITSQLPSNCTPVITSPELKNSLLLRYWQLFKLPVILKRYNADVFIPSEINPANSIRCRQLIITDRASLSGHSSRGRKDLYDQLIKAEHIFCTSPKVQNELISVLKNKDAVTLIHPEIGEKYSLIRFEDAEIERDKLSDGNNFLLVKIDDSRNAISILKSLSIFKKLQRSRLQLIFNCDEQTKELVMKDLKTYKYRDDVKFITENLSAETIASAYAVADVTDQKNTNLFGLKVLKSGVPLIVDDNENNKLIFGQAALYSVLKEAVFAEKIMKIYKDENFRTSLVQSGLALISQYNDKSSVEEVWKAIALPL